MQMEQVPLHAGCVLLDDVVPLRVRDAGAD
jgi:hypothetical protein